MFKMPVCCNRSTLDADLCVISENLTKKTNFLFTPKKMRKQETSEDYVSHGGRFMRWFHMLKRSVEMEAAL